jgi:hypothetical protein
VHLAKRVGLTLPNESPALWRALLAPLFTALIITFGFVRIPHFPVGADVHSSWSAPSCITRDSIVCNSALTSRSPAGHSRFSSCQVFRRAQHRLELNQSDADLLENNVQFRIYEIKRTARL